MKVELDAREYAAQRLGMKTREVIAVENAGADALIATTHDGVQMLITAHRVARYTGLPDGPELTGPRPRPVSLPVATTAAVPAPVAAGPLAPSLPPTPTYTTVADPAAGAVTTAGTPAVTATGGTQGPAELGRTGPANPDGTGPRDPSVAPALTPVENGDDSEKTAEADGLEKVAVNGDQDDVPAGSAKDVLAWVGDDQTRARQALEAEKAKPSPRSGLLKDLESAVSGQ